MGDFLKTLNTKKEEFCVEAVEHDHYLKDVNFEVIKEQC